MKLRFISYGYKHYEAEGKSAPEHDFLFHLRDIINPFWVPELKELTGQDPKIQEYFAKDPACQDRLQKIKSICIDFSRDFLANPNRQDGDQLCFAFRCTGGKHRSVYFAEQVAAHINGSIDTEIELEHVDLPRYAAKAS